MPLEKYSDKQLEKIANGDLSEVSDADLETMASSEPGIPKILNPSSESMTKDVLVGAGQGLSLGYGPQIYGAARSKSFSGPEYESEKQKAERAVQESGATGTLSELGVGGILGELAALPKAVKGAGLLGRAAIGAAQSGLPSTGLDVGSQEDLISRLKSAGIGAGINMLVPGAGKGLEKSAYESATRATMPMGQDAASVYGKATYKKGVEEGKKVLDKTGLQNVGQTLREEKVIGGWPFKGPENLFERAKEARQKVGKEKGDLISFIDNKVNEAVSTDMARLQPAIPGQSSNEVKFGVNRNAIVDKLKTDLRMSPELPDAEEYNKKLDRFLNNFSKDKEYINVKRADELKTELYNNLPKKTWIPTTQQEKWKNTFNKGLARELNKGVDDAAEFIAKNYAPETLDKLKTLKQKYGNLDLAADALEKKVVKNISNSPISLRDTIIAGAGVPFALSQIGEKNIDETKVAMPVILGALSGVLRRYGNQMSSTGKYNLGKLMQRPGLIAMATGAVPMYERAENTKQKRLKALEE